MNIHALLKLLCVCYYVFWDSIKVIYIYIGKSIVLIKVWSNFIYKCIETEGLYCKTMISYLANMRIMVTKS